MSQQQRDSDQTLLSGELFRALAEASAAITFVYQGERNVFANPAAEAATGYSRAELAELKFWDIIHPDSQELVRQRGMARQRGEAVPPSYEVQIVTKSGDVRWLEFTGKVVDINGAVAVLGTAFDVTERKRAQEALATSEAVYRRLVDNALVGVLRTNLAGRILYANRATLRIFGFETLDALQSDGMLARYQDPQERERLLRGLREDGLVEQFEVGFLRGTGEAIRVVASVVLEEDILSGVLMDVTEQRRLEREALRVQKLDSLALFAGGLAHDFNNFMASILNNLTLARRMTEPRAADAYLGAVEQAVLRARGLTDQLLTFARSGGSESRTELVAPESILREPVNFALRGSGVDCTWDLPPHLPSVEVDPGQITQVVHNLVLNAVQAMSEGGTLRVSVRRVEESETDRLQVVFQDEGPGIPAEIQGKIFDPYFTTKPKGSGLGLAAADAIVRRHGGTLRVESEPGNGARFLLELPAREPSQEQARDLPDRDPSRSPGACSILVLDDDPGVLHSTCGLLTALGYRATPVQDGALALELLAEAPCDLLLLDLTIPGGMGGIQVLEHVRQQGSTVPAILVTGYAADSVREACDALGAATLLRKPFTLEDLSSSIQGALASASQ